MRVEDQPRIKVGQGDFADVQPSGFQLKVHTAKVQRFPPQKIRAVGLVHSAKLAQCQPALVADPELVGGLANLQGALVGEQALRDGCVQVGRHVALHWHHRQSLGFQRQTHRQWLQLHRSAGLDLAGLVERGVQCKGLFAPGVDVQLRGRQAGVCQLLYRRRRQSVVFKAQPNFIQVQLTHQARPDRTAQLVGWCRPRSRLA